MNDDDLSTSEAAVILRVTIREVRALCRAGVFVCRKNTTRWLLSRASVLAYVATLAERKKPS